MFLSQRIPKLPEFAAQSFGRVMAMMEMNLDFAISFGANLRQSIKTGPIVLFPRIEESVLRTFPVCIVQISPKARVFIDPSPDNFARLVRRRVPPERLKVIGDAEQQVPRL
jgi:hypothetical protein